MKKGQRSLSVLLVSLLVCITAVVTVPVRSLGASISYDVNVNSLEQTGYLPQFDPSLGSLTGVTYSGNVEVGELFQFEQFQSNVSYDAVALFALVGRGLPSPPSFFSGGNTLGTFSFDPPTNFGGISANVSESGSLGVGYFDGTGLINVQVAANITVDVPTLPLGERAGGVEGELTFTYTYLPNAIVPEPPGLVLASIAALLPLYLIVKRRFTKRPGCA